MAAELPVAVAVFEDDDRSADCSDGVHSPLCLTCVVVVCGTFAVRRYFCLPNTVLNPVWWG